jgi:uncharacterized membrane protein
VFGGWVSGQSKTSKFSPEVCDFLKKKQKNKKTKKQKNKKTKKTKKTKKLQIGVL